MLRHPAVSNIPSLGSASVQLPRSLSAAPGSRSKERERERERQKERGSVPGVSIYRELEVMRVWFLRVFVVLFLGFAMF